MPQATKTEPKNGRDASDRPDSPVADAVPSDDPQKAEKLTAPSVDGDLDEVEE